MTLDRAVVAGILFDIRANPGGGAGTGYDANPSAFRTV